MHVRSPLDYCDFIYHIPKIMRKPKQVNDGDDTEDSYNDDDDNDDTDQQSPQ